MSCMRDRMNAGDERKALGVTSPMTPNQLFIRVYPCPSVANLFAFPLRLFASFPGGLAEQELPDDLFQDQRRLGQAYFAAFFE